MHLLGDVLGFDCNSVRVYRDYLRCLHSYMLVRLSRLISYDQRKGKLGVSEGEWALPSFIAHVHKNNTTHQVRSALLSPTSTLDLSFVIMVAIYKDYISTKHKALSNTSHSSSEVKSRPSRENLSNNFTPLNEWSDTYFSIRCQRNAVATRLGIPFHTLSRFNPVIPVHLTIQVHIDIDGIQVKVGKCIK